MYIVISMPNRKSVACGVSHFITLLLLLPGDVAKGAAVPSKNRCQGLPLFDPILPQCAQLRIGTIMKVAS
jgi:hypothetical protein